MGYEHQTCSKDFSKVSTTLQHLKCWVVTTSGIAGLQGNSIKYHTLDKYGTQILLVGSPNLASSPGHFQVFFNDLGIRLATFNLLHEVHHSGGLYDPSQAADSTFLVVSTISEVFC